MNSVYWYGFVVLLSVLILLN